MQVEQLFSLFTFINHEKPTRSEESAAGANGAEGAGSSALLGSQPITVGWVQRRTKFRTQCNHRLDTSTGATRRRSAGNLLISGASRHLAFSQSVTSLYFAVQKKRYGGSRTHKGGTAAAVPIRCRVLNPAGGSGRGAPTGVWGGNPRQVSGRPSCPGSGGVMIANYFNYAILLWQRCKSR